MITLYIYLKNGNVDKYDVEDEWKAREHAEKIWQTGLRKRVGNRLEWFGPHYIDKICWDIKNPDYLCTKYGE